MKQMIDRMIKDHRALFEKNDKDLRVGKIRFMGVDGYDVYNPTAPFPYRGKELICARVERRDSEQSEAVFFEKCGEDSYRIAENLQRFSLQDPCLTRVHDEWILGGTEVFPQAVRPWEMCWRTVFYRGEALESLVRFAEGPIGMKDVRLVELQNGRIGIFTRPQGEKGGRGKIGFTTVSDFSEVTAERMDGAPLLDFFGEEEWGGVNETYLLADGTIGVLGHIACFEPEEVRHYYPMTFVMDPETRRCTEPVILAERSEFLPGASKRPDLEDVLFSGGMVLEDRTATLYVGVSDCEIQYMQIANPFKTNLTQKM